MRGSIRIFQTRGGAAKEWFTQTFEPLRPVFDAWMVFVRALNWVLVRVFLTLLFFTVFLIYGVVLRLFRKDPMNRRLSDDIPSYWTGEPIINEGIDQFKRQF